MVAQLHPRFLEAMKEFEWSKDLPFVEPGVVYNREGIAEEGKITFGDAVFGPKSFRQDLADQLAQKMTNDLERMASELPKETSFEGEGW